MHDGGHTFRTWKFVEVNAIILDGVKVLVNKLGFGLEDSSIGAPGTGTRLSTLCPSAVLMKAVEDTRRAMIPVASCSVKPDVTTTAHVHRLWQAKQMLC